jgi:hypothetical protein
MAIISVDMFTAFIFMYINSRLLYGFLPPKGFIKQKFMRAPLYDHYSGGPF